MSGMDDLVTWLRTQLDDDERVARAATQGAWRWADAGGRDKMALLARSGPTDQVVVPSRIPDVYPSVHDADHIARWDPARVLAEIDTKRCILDWCERAERAIDLAEIWNVDVSDVVELLALPYAGREGYREEWRPSTT